MATRQPKMCVAAGLAALLLWSSGAWAVEKNKAPPSSESDHGRKISDENVCENRKLEAAANYFQCLIGVYRRANIRGTEPWEGSIVWCGEDFDRAFEHAESGGACHTPGGASTLREPIKAQVSRLADHLSDVSHCTITPGETVVCQLDKTTTAVDLAALVSQLSGFGVTEDTAFWIQAWGGDGSDGNNCCENGGTGGHGGYAQTTTSLSAFQSAFGTTELYYYMGLNGTYSANAGGDGGTATLVTVNDLSEHEVTLNDTLLVAGGGGGGGGARLKINECYEDGVFAENGGFSPGVVASPSSPPLTSYFTVDKGNDGTNKSNSGRSGQGGQKDVGGTAGFGSTFNGGNPIAPLGGAGGMHDTPQIGFVNASATMVSGSGGQGQGDSPNDAGGGGGSSMVQVLANSPACAAVPKNRPSNPNGAAGFVQITFDIGVCQ